MYIKQVIINGFKSYRDETIIEPFSSKHNVIVGRNGSGKSNFFSAIRFVLSDAYTHMGREERQALLHEGSGQSVLSAYVEIIFDNSDNRFPTGHDEVLIKRTIGLMKDEYSIDRKAATKTDVMNILEAGGFSRANPYYIVPQGRITALTVAKDAERLQLIKEVAGTKVYENRRTESLKIIDDTTAKIQKVDELLKFIDDRLHELEEEKTELKEFQNLDSERRSLEYTLYSRELDEINSLLSSIEDSEGALEGQREAKLQEFVDRERECAELKERITQMKKDVDLKNVNKMHAEDELQRLIKSRAQLEMLSVNAADDSVAQKNYEQKLNEIEAKIKQREKAVAELSPQVEIQEEKRSHIQRELSEIEAQVKRLQSQRGRAKHFTNKGARDDWLKNEIVELENTLKESVQLRQEMMNDMVATNEELDSVTQKINELRQRIGSRDELSSLLNEYNSMKERLDLMQNERKLLWRETASLESVTSNLESNVQNATRKFQSILDRNTAEGLETCRKIAEQKNIEGFYGPLCDLFKVDSKYATAVDVAAGPSLFHVVVEDDTVATELIEAMKRESSGRVTFMPLNRLHPNTPSNIPSSDVIPIIKKLDFEDRFLPAFQQVFAKSIICPNIETASHYARQFNLTAVTLQGDKADRKGALTGGYQDIRKSRFRAAQELAHLRASLKEENGKLVETRKKTERADQDITAQISDMQKFENKRRSIENSMASATNELSTLTQSQSEIEDMLRRKRQHLKEIENDILAFEKQLENSKKELNSPFLTNLSAADEKRLKDLTKKSEELGRKLSEVSTNASHLETERQNIDNELRRNLYLSQDQLLTKLSRIGSADSNTEIENRRALSKCIDDIETVEKQIQKLMKEYDLMVKNCQDAQKKLDGLKETQIQSAEIFEREQKDIDVNLGKKSLLLQQKSKATKSIRDLGLLPADAFDRFQSLSSEKILKSLHKARERLKKYGHVNKRAFDQFNSFTKQQSQLQDRRKELAESLDSIHELVSVLDQRKDEALERTFKQVSKNFTDVFSKLVPAGVGRLIMQRFINQEDDGVDGETDDYVSSNKDASQQSNSIENYVGVSISVSFNSKHDEQQRIQQLSGGQKSLCALALIFAIQRCDPAPFYLFDEIDANLDAQYRLSLAEMLKEMSQTGQFICTTFRPEQIQVAGDKFYGVYFNNKISSIEVVSKEIALEFIDTEAR